VTEVRYHEAAHEELLGELGYLELRKRGLGRRFLGEVRRAEALIAQFPLAGEEIVPGIRKRPLRKFRYSLFYALDENGNVLILAVAHQSRQPGYWIGRMHEG
jgi:plasmid stabilization system protein ParE